MPTRPIGIVLGSGGHAREILSLLDFELYASLYSVGPAHKNDQLKMRSYQVEIIDNDDLAISNLSGGVFYLGVANPFLKRRLTSLYRRNFEVGNLVHSTALIDQFVTMNSGHTLAQNSLLMSNVVIGEFVHIGRGAMVGHDSSVGSYSHVNPGAIISGHVTVGQDCLIGAGSVILEGLTVGNGAIVGAGSVVTQNVDSDSVVIGNPARVMDK
jgi:sugar O-acyltransferase (sialic acid O-acetyltransferase NeuD family)